MKKSYLPPHSEVYELFAETPILAGSDLGNGSDDQTGITVGGEHDGTFQSGHKGWNSSNWAE